MNRFEWMFPSKKHYHVFLLLCLTTLLDFILVAYRLYYLEIDLWEMLTFRELADSRSKTFLFLVWNLFLAWIPYCISLSLERLPARWLATPVLLTWLVFFPNAPYIVTDLLHVRYRPPVPLWYDTMMIFSFAWTGLMLGFLSLLEVQRFLEKNVGKQTAAILTGIAIVLCAFGVYLGRYQRWNTWDVVLNPYQLIWDCLAVLTHPAAYLGSLGLAVVMTGILGAGYLTLKTLVSRRDY